MYLYSNLRVFHGYIFFFILLIYCKLLIKNMYILSGKNNSNVAYYISYTSWHYRKLSFFQH